MIQFRRIALAAVAVAALLTAPLAASAAQQSAAPLTLTTTASGALSISAATLGTFPSTAVSAGTLATHLHSAQYTDSTGTGSGWSASLAVQQFQIVPGWIPASGSMALVDAGSPAYSGTKGAGSYTVTVLGVTGSGATATVSYKWTGDETGTAPTPIMVGVRAAVGTHNITITFPSGIAPVNIGNTYSVKVGNFDPAALTINPVTTTINLVSGGALPVATGNTTVTAGPVVADSSTYGTAVKFATAAVGTGNGTYTMVPGATLTWDPNATWVASYQSSAQYSITAGP